MNQVSELLEKLFSGSIQAVSKVITLVENEMPESLEVLQRLYPHTGRAYVIGITGPQGSGKSTLLARLTKELRQRDYTVGILAVDPSSPFSGGAILGDRIRMQEIADDNGVFVRSMATRGTLGGLTKTTKDAVKILDAFGKNFIIIETVGVGQDEIEIIKIADCTLLVSVPGLGDEIQALKAGIMEIGDIFVVNKADREGSDRLATELMLMLDMGSPKIWSPPIIKTVATTGEGIFELTEKILEQRKFLENGNGLWQKRRERAREEIISLIEREISTHIHELLQSRLYFLSFDSILEQVVTREKDPYSFAKMITEPFSEYCREMINTEARVPKGKE